MLRGACSQAAAPRTEAVVNYLALPQPVKYEEIQKEALSAWLFVICSQLDSANAL